MILDASIVNVALPSIQRDLGFSQENLQWVVNAYTLAFGGFLLLGGRAADLLGRRAVFMVGLVLFALASLAGGLAGSEEVLVGARFVQGLGAAILSPAALSIITTTFAEGAERNRALGIWGALAGAGGAAGVLLGGVLTEYLGWEWVLFVNVPIAGAAAALSPLALAESRRDDVGKRRFDVAGAIAVTAGLVVLVFALVRANEAGIGSFQTLGLLGLSVALLVAFVAIEARSQAPLMPLRIFKQRTLSGSNIVGLLTGASLFSMFFFVSLYLQQVLGFSALKSGVAYLPLAVTIIVAAGGASVLVTRVGFKPVLVAGMLLIASGLIWFSRITPPPDGAFVSDVLFASLLAAVGLGFAFVPVTIGAVAGVRAEESGLASGLINTSQQVGGALGLAVLSTIAISRTENVLADAGAAARQPAERLAALTDGFQAAFLTGAGFAVVGALVALLFIRNERIEGLEALPVAA